MNNLAFHFSRYVLSAVIGLGFAGATLNSICAQEEGIADDWVEVAPAGISLKLKMPIEPKYRMRTMSPEAGISVDFHSYMSTIENGNLTYLFNHHRFPKTPVGNSEIRKTLDDAVSGGVMRVSGDVETHTPISNSNMRGRDLVYTFSDAQGNDFRIHTQIFIRGGSMYTLSVVGLEDNFTEQGAQAFFDGMTLTKQKNPARTEEAPQDN